VKVLLVPAVQMGMGSGHLRRALKLAEHFGRESGILLEDLEGSLKCNLDQLLGPLQEAGSRPGIVSHYDPEDCWDLVLLDRRSSTRDQMARFAPTSVVCLDEGGPARRYASYLIDTFPSYRQNHAPNLSALTLLDLPERRAALHFPFRKPLISFGGEDPADLSTALVELLLEGGLYSTGQITLVEGSYFSRHSWPEEVVVLKSPRDLKSELYRYDLLFTSYGLTTFEALATGVPVINFNPSRYHRNLSRAAGIPEIGIRKPRAAKLIRLLRAAQPFERLLARYPAAIFSGGPTAGELTDRIRPSGPARCPVCSEILNKALVRFEQGSYFRCRKCGILYFLAFGQQPKRYRKEYFFSEYEAQYGRTYLEDFQAIKRAGARRLEIIGKLRCGLSSGWLLDVGCAFGPFLQAAVEAGFQAQGLDISAEAARYVHEELGIPCRAGDFSSPDAIAELDSTPGSFDVLTMWYVLEHFRDPAAVLTRVNRLLKPGGIFAFSTPSASGISARRNERAFLEQSPLDHFTIWPPGCVAGVLRRFGFRLKTLRSTGHHGERFFPSGRLQPGSPVSLLLTQVSRILRLGDTFEAYAEKVREL